MNDKSNVCYMCTCLKSKTINIEVRVCSVWLMVNAFLFFKYIEDAVIK